MGTQFPPRNPHAFAGYASPYRLTPTDKVRLLAEGFTAEDLLEISDALARDLGPYVCRLERERTVVLIDARGLLITKY